MSKPTKHDAVYQFEEKFRLSNDYGIRWILEPCTEHVELHLSHSRIVAIMGLERGKIRVKLLENDKKTNRARSRCSDPARFIRILFVVSGLLLSAVFHSQSLRAFFIYFVLG